jgi:hypothetical protein
MSKIYMTGKGKDRLSPLKRKELHSLVKEGQGHPKAETAPRSALGHYMVSLGVGSPVGAGLCVACVGASFWAIEHVRQSGCLTRWLQLHSLLHFSSSHVVLSLEPTPVGYCPSPTPKNM